MSTAIYDEKSHITNMDVIQGTTPKLTSRRNLKKDDGLTTHHSIVKEQTKSTRQQAVPIITNTSLYTTFSNIFYLYGMKFYRYLTPSKDKKRVNLIESEVIDNDSWIFAFQPPAFIGGKRAFVHVRGTKLYDFIVKYLTEIPLEERNFYEVIRPLPQKPRFDLDGDLGNFNDYDDMVLSTDNALQLLLLCIEQVFKDYNVPYNPSKDLFVFPSNGVTKRSYHVVIDNWAHSDNKEAEAFYHVVVDQMKSIGYNNNVIVDPKVYNSNQQFRLLGSQKRDSNRPKVLCTELSRTP